MSARRTGMAEAVARARIEARVRPLPQEVALALDLDHAADLADQLGAILRKVPRSGLSGSDLAREANRRKADVLAVLDADGRFVRVGRSRLTRWRLRGTEREPLSGHSGSEGDQSATATSPDPENVRGEEAA